MSDGFIFFSLRKCAMLSQHTPFKRFKIGYVLSFYCLIQFHFQAVISYASVHGAGWYILLRVSIIHPIQIFCNAPYVCLYIMLVCCRILREDNNTLLIERSNLHQLTFYYDSQCASALLCRILTSFAISKEIMTFSAPFSFPQPSPIISHLS